MITYVFKGLDENNKQFRIDIVGNSWDKAIEDFKELYPNHTYNQIKEI